jgi:hypothetical protein
MASVETVKLLKELEESLAKMERSSSSSSFSAPSALAGSRVLSRPLLKIDSTLSGDEEGDNHYEKTSDCNLA